jgi:hypothetical protein
VSEDCPRCAELEDLIEDLEDRLEQIAVFCQQAIDQANAEALGHSSGIPRGTWAYWLGIERMAQAILSVL